MTHSKYTHVVGIDEVGRGPLAGPVAVCAVIAARDFDIPKAFPGLNDSKVLSPQIREELYARAVRLVAYGDIRFAVAFESHEVVDGLGISVAIQRAIDTCLRTLAPVRGSTHIFLDGSLHAPREYSQKTVIRGDALVPAISLASVIAKVTRDAFMVDLAREYPQYGFDRHKGYGTASHIAALKAHGPSPLHRRSFISKILVD